MCIKVTKQRPKKPADWDEIPTTLNAQFLTKEKNMQLKGRGCRQHLVLLLKKYKEEDAKALKRCVCVCFKGCVLFLNRSRTEEEYKKLQQLLENICVYNTDCEAKRKEEQKSAVLKKAADKKEEEEMRRTVMEDM